MKIRIGFVSNSSSSSYLICGIKIDRKSIGTKRKKEILAILGAECEDNDSDVVDEVFYETLSDTDNIYSEDDDTYIGKYAYTMGTEVVNVEKLKEEAVSFIKKMEMDTNKMKFYLLHHIDH